MSGNAELIKGMGQWGNLAGKVSQFLWPTLKPEIEAGKLSLSEFDDTKIKQAIRRGFFPQVPDQKDDLGLNIGKVSREELAKLSVWELKKLYSLFYKQVYGLFLDFPDELMPEASDEFSWPVCVPGFITNESAYWGIKPDWQGKYRGVPALQIDRGRDAWRHAYVVRVRNSWEPDDLMGLTANEMEASGIDIIMFRERAILGNFINWLTGECIDENRWTLTGSRCDNGDVLHVYGGGGRTHIEKQEADTTGSGLCTRQVVSIPLIL